MLVTILNNESDKDCLFNPQATVARSSTASAGIEISITYGIFRSIFHLSIEDCVQEEGRVGRRVGAMSATNW